MAQHEDYQEVTLARSGLRPLRFRGREVWRWETSPDSAHPAYSGSPGRWRVLVLYQAEHGGYYLHDQQLTNWRGEHDHRAVVPFATLAEVADWLESNCPGAAPDFCHTYDLAEELPPERLPEEVSVVSEEQVGAVTVRVVTDGVQFAWELSGPGGRLLAESQPAPVTREQAEREALLIASAVALRYREDA